MGHAQHDPAEYVPKEQRAYWESRDPIALYEKFLSGEKLLDDKSKKEVDSKIDALLAKERDFAENSPMPPPELAEKGVYCTGDDCHKIRPKWERPLAEVTPPKSSIAAVWTIEGFGAGKGSGGKNAPIHFGDTAETAPAVSPQEAEEEAIEEKLAPRTPVKVVAKKSPGRNGKNGASTRSSKSVGGKSAGKSVKPAAKSSAGANGKSSDARRAPAGKARH